jgi:hypothetical protein
MMRKVICHYHIYKNAGTSFDHVLTHSFGDRHLSFDGPFPFFVIDQDQLDRIIERKGDAIAFSSHQIQLPAPVSRHYRVLPVVFLRDPALRIASIWRFKARHPDGTTTSAAAGAMGFAAWVAHCLDDPQEIAHVSNAQTRLLSAPFRDRPRMRRMAGRMEYDLARAEANLAGAAAVGRADHFSTDIHGIAAVLAAEGLPLTLPPDLHCNATAASALPTELRRRAVLDDLPADLAERLLAANDQDAALYALAGQHAATLPKAA